MAGWHRRMSRMGSRLRDRFGTPGTLHFDGGASVPLSVIFDLEDVVQEVEGEEVIDRVPRAGIYREDLPLVAGVPREPVAYEDTLELDDLAVADGITIPQGTYVITEVRKDSGSMLTLYLQQE